MTNKIAPSVDHNQWLKCSNTHPTLLYKEASFFCLKLKISTTTEPIDSIIKKGFTKVPGGFYAIKIQIWILAISIPVLYNLITEPPDARGTAVSFFKRRS